MRRSTSSCRSWWYFSSLSMFVSSASCIPAAHAATSSLAHRAISSSALAVGRWWCPMAGGRGVINGSALLVYCCAGGADAAAALAAALVDVCSVVDGLPASLRDCSGGGMTASWGWGGGGGGAGPLTPSDAPFVLADKPRPPVPLPCLSPALPCWTLCCISVWVRWWLAGFAGLTSHKTSARPHWRSSSCSCVHARWVMAIANALVSTSTGPRPGPLSSLEDPPDATGATGDVDAPYL
mmetsp:Transcript_44629/g.126156  ORF Transcript_44629/g.126156 Transcript_44629/m.126156 type:complete len:238 (-) Transcript_44629:948-1661(-)